MNQVATTYQAPNLLLTPKILHGVEKYCQPLQLLSSSAN